MDIQTKERIEIDYWETSPTEQPGSESIENLLNKTSDARVFLERIRPFDQVFRNARCALELGAGQGWASCLVKSLYPHLKVVVSDISPHAIASLKSWERVYQVNCDDAFACQSYDIPLPDESIDLIFCFAAAHHFVAHRRTLTEVKRVLRAGGSCFYFHEPSCNQTMYRLAHRRVNRIRPDVPEDVLITSKIVELATEQNLNVELLADTSLLKRGPKETVYYLMLNKLPLLQRLLPCTHDYHFKKR